MLKKKIVGGFPLNFERSVASRQLLLSGRGGKKSRAIKKKKLSVSSFGSQVSNAGAQGESFLRVGSVLNWKKIMYLSHLEILQHRYTDTNISIERQTM